MDVFLTGFSKKLLVAISIVVLLTMCVMPVEARSVEHQRRHHRKQDGAAQTKELSRRNPEQIRHPKLRVRVEKNPKVSVYKDSFHTIFKSIKHNLITYHALKNNLSEYDIYHNGKPDWLPKVNFHLIHNFNYRAAKRSGATILERKFVHMIPKLYKSLKNYEEIFSTLLQTKLAYVPDTTAREYQIQRKRFLQNTLNGILGIQTDILDSFADVNMTAPQFDRSKLKLEPLRDAPVPEKLISNDYIALRGYGKLLMNWFYEFKCSSTNSRRKKTCVRYEKKLNAKHDERNGLTSKNP